MKFFDLAFPSSKTVEVKRKIKLRASFTKSIGPRKQWSSPIIQQDTGDVWQLGYDWCNPTVVKLLLVSRGNGSTKKLPSNISVSPISLTSDCYYPEDFETKILPGEEISCSICPNEKLDFLTLTMTVYYIENVPRAVYDRRKSSRSSINSVELLKIV